MRLRAYVAGLVVGISALASVAWAAGIFVPTKITSLEIISSCASVVGCVGVDAPAWSGHELRIHFTERLMPFRFIVRWRCADGNEHETPATGGGLFGPTETRYFIDKACYHERAGTEADEFWIFDRANLAYPIYHVAVNLTVGGADLALGLPTLSTEGCVLGSTCDEVKFSVNVASELAAPYALTLDLGDTDGAGADTACTGAETDCDDPCFESPLVTGDADGIFANVLLPDLSTAKPDALRFCVEDAAGGGAGHAAQTTAAMAYETQQIVVDMSPGSPTCVAGSCAMNLTLTVDQASTTCPWSSQDGWSTTSEGCGGAGCVASLEYQAGLQHFTGATHTFAAACTCSTPVRALPGVGIIGCGDAPATLATSSFTVLQPEDRPACDDDQDNDGDALIDYPADPGCSSALSDTEAPACDDGEDNDGDNFTDAGLDPGCSSGADTDEHASSLICDNGLDDDGDSQIDLTDPSCNSLLAPRENAQCEDNLDNDSDGTRDHVLSGHCGGTGPVCDADCAHVYDNDESGTTPTLCANGLDDDGDTLIDLADPGCGTAASNTESPHCDDGVDNDGDARVDWDGNGTPANADPGCGGNGSSISEHGGAVCDNGLDDDGDGIADYPNDPGCADVLSATENPACDDGVDNDGDGDIDWDGGASTPPGSTLYTTIFSSPLTEYPLSQGGAWVQNNPQHITSFNRIEAYNGVAYQVLSPAWGTYDGVSHLQGFPDDQWIEGTFYVEPGYTFPGAASEGALAVRMTTRGTGATVPHSALDTYVFAYGIWGAPPYNGNMLIGVWDGNGSDLGEPNVFYGSFTQQLSGHADCAAGPRNGDVLRLTVQGSSPPRLNAYIKRNDGSPAWVHCTPFDVQDNGPSSILGLQPGGSGNGPSWHTPNATGNPGITSFQNNSVPRKQGWTTISAGSCPAWPVSCAP